MTITDQALYGRPTTETDPARQAVRNLDRLSYALENVERALSEARTDATTPFHESAELEAEIDAALAAVLRLQAWAWATARAMPRKSEAA